MSNPPGRRLGLSLVARWCAIATLALPLPSWAAAEGAGRSLGNGTGYLLLSAGLVAVLGAWWYYAAKARRRLRHAEQRVHLLNALTENSNALLWEAKVELRGPRGDWQWKIHPSAFARQLFEGAMPEPDTDMWQGFEDEQREERVRKCRAALEQSEPGYSHEFQVTRNGRKYRLRETVVITRKPEGRCQLFGMVVELSSPPERQDIRPLSEFGVNAILAHADCVVWQARVSRQSEGDRWEHFDIPTTRLSGLLFGNRVYSPERGFWDSLSLPDAEAMHSRSRHALESDQPGYVQEFRAITQNGREFWLTEQVTLTRTGSSTWVLVGVITDITAQKKAEEAARRSELQLAYLLERADTMLWQAQVVQEPEGALRWEMYIPKSQVYRRIFSAEPQNPLGFAWDQRGVAEFRQMADLAAQALRDDQPGYEQIIRVPLASGSIWLNESVTISKNGPNAWELVGIITDITARHEAEQAWQLSQSRLGNLLELADCMIWDATVTQGADDALQWVLQTQPSVLSRRIFGDTPAESSGLIWQSLPVPEYETMAARVRDAVRHRRSGYSHEFHVVLPHETIWLREVVTLNLAGENRMHLVGVVTDVTAVHDAVSALRTSEQRLETLLEKADCMIWQGEVTRDGTDEFTWRLFTPRSNLFRRLFGHDPEGICHLTWDNGAVPDLDEMRARSRQAMVQNLTGYEQTFCYEHPENGRIWLSEKVNIKSLGSNHWELSGIITDITAQQQADASRQVSEHRLQEILARADCLLWEAEVEAETWSWSFHVQPSGLGSKLYGPGQHTPGHRLWHFFNIPERAEMDLRSRTAMMTGEREYEQVFHIVREGYPDLWVRESVSIRHLPDGRYSLVGVAVDISLQLTAEAALAAEKERLAVTLRAMSESVISTDVNGRIRFMNPAAATLTGWPAEGCIGRQVQLVCPLVNNQAEHPMAAVVDRVTQGDEMIEFPHQTWLMNREGQRRLIEGCCAPIHAADSKLLGTVLVLRDVTERDRLEQELERATRLESVGVLAGGIAHDFNNILTAVMGNLTLAQLDLPADTPVAASLQAAEKAALRARDLTQQLLTFARGGEPVRAAVQLDAIIREVTGFALHGSNVRPHFDMAPDLWPADADKGQIGRVVQNMVINAVQAMPQGGSLQILVRNDPQSGSARPGLAPGDYLQIAISDTGEGIKAEDLPRIFDPYFTTKSSGTGLGLAAVYSIVKKHRGHIEVESQPGQGTTFRIWLPAMHDRRLSGDQPIPPSPQATVQLRGRVLFMDDEPSIRTMAEALFRRFGLEVTCVADGADAVAAYQAALQAGVRFDLVVMDLTVPGGMGGLAAIGQLKLLDPTVKAVVSSGYSSDPIMANFRAHGFVARVAKPYVSHEIARVLRELLPLG